MGSGLLCATSERLHDLCDTRIYYLGYDAIPNHACPSLSALGLPSGARGGTRTRKPFGTRSLILRVYQFRHSRVEKQDGDYTRHQQDANGVFTFDASFCEWGLRNR